MAYDEVVNTVEGFLHKTHCLDHHYSVCVHVCVFECSCVNTHVNIIGIDVVRVGVSIQQLQSDSGVIVCGIR